MLGEYVLDIYVRGTRILLLRKNKTKKRDYLLRDIGLMDVDNKITEHNSIVRLVHACMHVYNRVKR